MVRPWRAPTTDERLNDTFYGERYPGQPDKAKGHLNSVSAVQRLFSTWWQVKDSNVRSFRDGSRVLRRQARDQGLSRGRDAGLAVFTAQLSHHTPHPTDGRPLWCDLWWFGPILGRCNPGCHGLRRPWTWTAARLVEWRGLSNRKDYRLDFSGRTGHWATLPGSCREDPGCRPVPASG